MKPIKPMGKSINATPWWQHVINALAVIAFTGLMGIVLVEWAAGCGENYVDANGVEHQHECLILDGSMK